MALAAALRPSHRRRGSPRSEEKGEHERVDWTEQREHDGRAAAAPLALKLNWATMFSYRFFRRAAREGVQVRRLLVRLDSRVVLGTVSKGRSSSRKINFLLRKLGFWCLAYGIALEIVCVPTWAKPADAPSRNKPIEDWHASLPKLPRPPTAVFASVHALAEPNLLVEPLSMAA